MLKRFKIDGFLLALFATVAIATVLPAEGTFKSVFGVLTDIAIGLLFFLHGAKLSRQAVYAGLMHWRLHLVVLASTYVLFPILGVGIKAAFGSLLTPSLAMGVLYLCALPSTVQSSIAFTSIAGGNVSAAVCAASGSSIIGIFLTPLLVSLLMNAHGGVSASDIWSIVEQLLLPFIAGQLLQPLVSGFVDRHKAVLGLVDRGSILMVVYLAFGEAMVSGLWTRVSLSAILAMAVIDAVLLFFVLFCTTRASRFFGFSKEDEITIVFCGSKKSLVSGVPMANVLFPASMVGAIVLPLMLFHQIQLMVCAALAKRYAARHLKETPAE